MPDKGNMLRATTEVLGEPSDVCLARFDLSEVVVLHVIAQSPCGIGVISLILAHDTIQGLICRDLHSLKILDIGVASFIAGSGNAILNVVRFVNRFIEFVEILRRLLFPRFTSSSTLELFYSSTNAPISCL